MLIDTHSHIYLPEFDDDRLDVIARAKATDIRHIILPNVDKETLEPMWNLEVMDQAYFHAAIGLHPTSVNANYRAELKWVKSELDRRYYCAIGEVGIDLYWDKTFRDEQIMAFEQQLQWAIDYQLPVIIHQRNAFEEAISSVEKYHHTGLSGIFHSFGGSEEEANRILALDNFFLGINGVVTFKNSHLADTLTQVPLNRLVLETDAPYLTPVPYRGKRNESSYLTFIAKTISEIYHTTTEEVEEITSRNALSLFSL
ncbi:TatD family hydrolase [Microbacter margulisiae]|uniref:TatD DNase family protein n=1 Tax=Microbacter margulisiae TaxID=1350067 RepID=A0A7W5DQ46_9PORP|nr:TatD family hydrolase [Microbacter margulisiae]MBB3186735.1 TatD DNase family protein [Microbacter margulisiae]